MDQRNLAGRICGNTWDFRLEWKSEAAIDGEIGDAEGSIRETGSFKMTVKRLFANGWRVKQEVDFRDNFKNITMNDFWFGDRSCKIALDEERVLLLVG